MDDDPTHPTIDELERDLAERVAKTPPTEPPVVEPDVDAELEDNAPGFPIRDNDG